MKGNNVARRNKKESVSVSIHYLLRIQYLNNNETKLGKFTTTDLDTLERNIKSQKPVDFKDQESIDRLRYATEIIVTYLERKDTRTLIGTFENPYSGHAFKNSHRGKIPAESVSLRPFHFMLYLSESGKIYIVAQYLGLYGGYSALQSTIIKMLPGYEDIEARTYRSDSYNMAKVEAKEVRVTLSRQSDSIAKNNVFTQSSVVTFKKSSKDDGFEGEVSEKLLQHVGKKNADVQRLIADVVNQSDLIDVRDTDIQDCTIIAKVNGKQQTIYMLDDGNFATKFPINVSLNSDGHPDFGQTKAEMLKILSNQIIAKTENV